MTLSCAISGAWFMMGSRLMRRPATRSCDTAPTAGPWFLSPMRRDRRPGWFISLLGLAFRPTPMMTSGDLTREVVAGRKGGAVFHIGPQRDISIFDGLDVHLTPVEAADYVVCSGLFDDTTETPDHYRDLMLTMRARSLFML